MLATQNTSHFNDGSTPLLNSSQSLNKKWIWSALKILAVCAIFAGAVVGSLTLNDVERESIETSVGDQEIEIEKESKGAGIWGLKQVALGDLLEAWEKNDDCQFTHDPEHSTEKTVRYVINGVRW